MSLVSVVIPCHNAERWVGETIDSVLAQTWPQVEVVVVDDGSEDDSVREVSRFAASGVRLFTQENRGAAAARNRGFAESRGEYIQFLDADDILAPEKLELQIRRLGECPGCVASAEWSRFRENIQEARFHKHAVEGRWDAVSWIVNELGGGGGMMFPAMWLVPRQVVTSAGPWAEYLSLNDDTEYFTRVLLSSKGILSCPGARCYYRSGLQSSLSGRKDKEAWESQFLVFALCESYLRAREDSQRVRHVFSVVWQTIAHTCYPYAPEIAEHALARAGALDPVTVKPDGGVAFRVVASLLGWRWARRLQRLSGRP